MSSRPHHHSLKGDSEPYLQKVQSPFGLHSSEGSHLAKNLTIPHPTNDTLFESEKQQSNPLATLFSGMKRTSDSATTQTSSFKSDCAQSRLFSPAEDNLQAQTGLTVTSFDQKADDYVPLNSLSSVLNSIKSRGRTISSASDSTIFSNHGTKQRCSKCQNHSESPLGTTFSTPQYLTPNYSPGKISPKTSLFFTKIRVLLLLTNFNQLI